MDDTTSLTLPTPDHDAVLAELAKLSRNHLLYFRIEVGRRLSKAFYRDDRALYRATNRQKEGSFREFVTTKAAELADLGLDERLLRESLRAFFVVKDLPRALVAQLVYSHVVKLTTVEDDATRNLLAQAIVDNHWTGGDVDSAIKAVREGRWPDADPNTPGLQPEGSPAAAPVPVEPEEDAAPQPGRVVTRMEKATKDVGALVGQWAAVPVEKLSKDQAKRVREALTTLEGQIAAMKARLPA